MPSYLSELLEHLVQNEWLLLIGKFLLYNAIFLAIWSNLEHDDDERVKPAIISYANVVPPTPLANIYVPPEVIIIFKNYHLIWKVFHFDIL